MIDKLDALAETIHDGVYGDDLLRQALLATRRGEAALDAHLSALTPEQLDHVQRQMQDLFANMSAAVS